MSTSPDWPSSLIDQFNPPQEFWSTEDDLGGRSWQGHEWEDVLCAICGIAITFGSAYQGPQDGHYGGKWLCEAVVIGDQTREYEYVQTHRKYRPIGEDPRVYSMYNQGWAGSEYKGAAVAIGPHHHNLISPVYASDYDAENGGPDGENTILFPLHRDCFHIALRAEVWNHAACTPLRALHRVLRHRYQVMWEQKLMNNPPPEPLCMWTSRRRVKYHYDPGKGWMYIRFSGFQNTEGVEKGYFNVNSMLSEDSRKNKIDSCLSECALPGGHYLRHSPLAIPDLTKTLLANLEPCIHSKLTRSVRSFRRRLSSLPNELQHLIFSYVTETHDWPLQCTVCPSCHHQIWRFFAA